MTSQDKATDLVTQWMVAFKRTSPTREHALIGETRFQILRNYLAHMGEDRFTALSLANQVAFCKAVGIEVPRTLVADSMRPPYSPGERQAVAERPAINAEGRMTMVGPTPYVRNGMTMDTTEKRTDLETNPIEAFREKAKAKAQARWKAEKEADERGEFWTVVGAYYPDHTFLMVYQGILKPDMEEAFMSQHTDAHMILEPATLLGTMSEVRCEAARQFQGKSTTDLRIRVLVKDRNQN